MNLNLKPVPDSPDRLDVLGLGCVVLNLFADFLDVNGHRGDITDGIHVPDLLG